MLLVCKIFFKMIFYFQNNVISSQSVILFSNDTIIGVNMYKNQLKHLCDQCHYPYPNQHIQCSTYKTGLFAIYSKRKIKQ